jgi:hypothetical protein
VVILKARLRNYPEEHMVVFTRDPRGNMFGSKNPIRAHSISEVSADFTFFPAIWPEPKPFVADVIFTDNYGEEHVLPSVRFKYLGP